MEEICVPSEWNFLNFLLYTHSLLFASFLNFGEDSIEQLYAFFYKPHPKHIVNDGWSVYDPLKEFERMGVTKNDAWRFSTVNRNYGVCNLLSSLFIDGNTRLECNREERILYISDKCTFPT